MAMKRIEGFTKDFDEVVNLIKKSRYAALKSVNSELINLYWKIGEYIDNKIKKAEWGEAIVDQLADHINKCHPELKGYTRRNLYRMRQFYETYEENKRVSALLTQITWTNHMLILSKTKTYEEKEFYILLTIKEKYSSRELERQIDSGLFERIMLSNTKLSPLLTQIKDSLPCKDTYILDFLDLPENHSENDLKTSIIKNLRKFILEIGRDFAYVGEEYRIQVGKSDFFIDLLFYHRELQCLVAFELKIEDFKPEHIGKMNFYLEALDRDVKKPHENPSVGIILCRSKDKDIIEYSMSRNMSPALVAEYKTKLIPKKVLQDKMDELFDRHDERKI